MKQNKTVEKYDGDLKQLSEDIGDLHYESLVEFFTNLQEKFTKDAKEHIKYGRKELSESIYDASINVMRLRYSIKESLDISKPFNKK